MSKQQLYIDGKAVDMPADEVKIKAESNIFNDIAKVKTAYTYNIVLPRTMTNDSIFALAYTPSANTGGKSTHRYIKASLYMDDIPLFSSGYAVLTSVDDKGYNLTILWGLIDIFSYIKDQGYKICNLVNKIGDAGTWEQAGHDMRYRNYVSGMSDDIYSTLDDDSKYLAYRLPWGMPVVMANDVLSLITTAYPSLTLDISATAQNRIDLLYHPLTSLKCLADDEECVINLRTEYYRDGSNWYCGFMGNGLVSNNVVNYYTLTPLLYDNPPSAFHSATNKYQATNALTLGAHNQILANCKIGVRKVRVFGGNPSAWSIEVNGETMQATYNAGTGTYTMDYTFTDEFSVDKADTFIGLTANTASSSQLATSINVQMYLTDIDFSNSCYDSTLGNWWSYVRNYPNMDVISYLNELMAHIGGCIVGSIKEPKQVRLMTIDEIAQATSSKYDMQGLSKITMSLNDLAQRNLYKHKENDDNGIKYLAEGVIWIDDSTLQIERTAFDSKFKVPYNAMVRLWKVEKINDSDKYKATWVGGDDYILGHDSDAQIYRNTGQDFASTINAYYYGYKEMVGRPKAIEVVVRLSVLDLLAFDFSKPVYINQLGRAYLVESLESDAGEQYKLNLVQI